MSEFRSELQTKRSLKRQSIYLLPNLFTLAALFAGFYGVVQAMNNSFEMAAVAVFIAMILDGMDGRVARLTHTQSAFGAEFDSLSDMVSFGVAPALISYEWMLKDHGKLGWIVAFIFCAAAALRLARFNTMVGKSDKRWFIGLPSPAAAALVVGLVWVCHWYNYLNIARLNWIVLFTTAFAGISMVLNVRFWSFKEIHIRRKVPFVAMLAVVAIWLLLVYQPPLVIFGFFVGYGFSGYVMVLLRKLRHRKHRQMTLPIGDEERH